MFDHVCRSQLFWSIYNLAAQLGSWAKSDGADKALRRNEGHV